MKTLHRLLPILLVALTVVVVIFVVGLIGGSSTITKARLERSLASSFTNRYLAQAQLLGKTGLSARSLDAKADCDKGGPKVADVGPGADWICQLSWHDPTVPLPDGSTKFELNVHSNNCYTAGGPSKYVGLVAIVDKRGREVPNPVFEWDACFDPGSDNSPTNALLVAAPNPPPSATTPPASGPAPIPSTLKVQTRDALFADGGRTVRIPLTCDGGKSPCVGTVSPKVGGRALHTVAFAIASGATGTLPLELTHSEAGKGVPISLRVDTSVGTPIHATMTLSVRKR